ncbi:Mu-like prophage major head subunit gpT family protein [Sulfitobacter sp. F26169L]|uniref:prohead protease/major capsid protein fusion protein n=1 Tax=Sulfitobacter sp. F26169L TaxID=2996015 RepID=UPI002260C8B5|nr:prohead protease/major capsid protein fusion protein [Sulfitobacter sp. F26169L]MCX7567132.1 Mu-like prophage major head subunit gpT family protein [Sulfitobacter sp. F26169L]
MTLETLIRQATTANSYDAATRTFEAVIATMTPVVRSDAQGPFNEILDPATLGASAGMPLLDSHRTDSVRDLLGRVLSTRIEGQQVIAKLQLSTASDTDPIAQRIADGSLTGVSIGYRVAGWSVSTAQNGTRQKTPTAWTLTEVTLTTNPADPHARVRHQEALGATARPSETTPTNRAANPTPSHTGANMPDPVIEHPVTPESAERTRRSTIRTLVRSAGLTAETADDLIDQDSTVDQAKAAVWDATQTRTALVIRTHVPQNDDPAVITRRMSDAVAVRMAGGECPDDARQYMGDSLLDLARDTLTRSGVSVRGLAADEVFTRAAHGTSDFPLVVSNAMGKVAADSYKAAETVLKQLGRQRVLRDFKPSTSIRVGEMGKLEEIAESGEIKATSRAETGESMSLKTFARAINVSRNLLVNDDLNLLGDMTAAFGEAAAQTEAEEMLSLLTSNPNLSDGTPVFDASRGNLSGAGADPSSAELDIVRKAMRSTTGTDGKTLISVTPKFLLVGPELENQAEKLLSSIYATTVGDVNAWSGKLSLLVEPRLTGNQWYVFADPARVASIVYGYLASAQGVQIQRAEAWDTLGIKYRAFLDFGTGWSDWRGAHKNPGS